MPEMSKASYNVLDTYVRAVLKRAGLKGDAFDDALADLMHPLTAWDNGNEQEFIPYMKLMLKEWKKKKNA